MAATTRQHSPQGRKCGAGNSNGLFCLFLLVFLSHGVCKSPYISLPACMHMALQGHCPFPQQQPSHGQERGARERCCLTTTASSAALFLPPSTHRPCDESHTQKLRKGLRSAGTEKEVCVVCPQTPEANAGGPQLGRAPDPGPVCCCQLKPYSGLAIDKALCARKDAPYADHGSALLRSGHTPGV